MHVMMKKRTLIECLLLEGPQGEKNAQHLWNIFGMEHTFGRPFSDASKKSRMATTYTVAKGARSPVSIWSWLANSRYLSGEYFCLFAEDSWYARDLARNRARLFITNWFRTESSWPDYRQSDNPHAMTASLFVRTHAAAAQDTAAQSMAQYCNWA
jgi:hypothetical protein